MGEPSQINEKQYSNPFTFAISVIQSNVNSLTSEELSYYNSIMKSLESILIWNEQINYYSQYKEFFYNKVN